MNHLLGTDPFDNAYDFIAADVTQEAVPTVDIFDMVAIRRVILGLDADFASGVNAEAGKAPSYRFVASNFEFRGNDGYAQTFPEVHNVNDLTGNGLDADFVAIDLAQPGRAELQVRSAAGQLVLTRTLNVTAGRNQIDLRAGELGPAGVYTYTLSANGFTATRQLVLLR